ncbi:MAG: murein L,D-transpeptidase catalytic domain family protein [Bacteroidaceae bacterium]|nr:murein L,D-transpeptidase catalytic domain family protein [Bacteroidaceae bacterium]
MKRKIFIITSVAFFLLLCTIILFRIIGNRLPDDIETKAQELKEYCVKNNYNTNIGVLVDYSVHSGRTRFIVWDFKNNKALLKSICAQGCGKGENQGKNVFSNEIGSLCSSLGHYKIGKERKMNSIKGRPALNLTGLESTNSNAIARGILIHPVHLPSFSIYPFSIPSKVYRIFGKAIMRPYSEGCVTVPFEKYKETVKILNKNKGRPVILWVYAN